MSEQQPNECTCGHLFGRLVEVQCAEGLYELIEMGGLRYFGMDLPCPRCGRRFMYKRERVRSKE
jgi:hypothetical protein